MKKRFEHDEACSCTRCVARELGTWFDQLGRQTESGKWAKFVTISYRTPSHPWMKGFPMSGSWRPNSEFGTHFFEYFVGQLEARLGEGIEYVVVDQYGKLNGRFHQHALLAGRGLDQYRRQEMEAWLNSNAGFSRVLPFKRGAAYYLARFAGRDLERADWRFRLGAESVRLEAEPKRGTVVACSAELPRTSFHQCLWNRRR